MNKEIVIAAYDKDMLWLKYVNNNVKKTVYRKGDINHFPGEIKLQNNVGRCVHTFFQHILNRYDTLADITFFAQDYPFDHWEDIIDVINNNLMNTRCQLQIEGYHGYHYNTITVPSEKGGIMWSLSDTTHHGIGKVLRCSSDGHEHDSNPDINVNKYWSILFDEPIPNHVGIYEFMPGGHFSLTKEHAHKRSRIFYSKIVELLEQESSAPWIIERLECYIFNPKYKTKL